MRQASMCGGRNEERTIGPMNIVIHHNPECGTSRNVLAIIEAAGYRPAVIDYLTTGWTRPQLLGLFAAADLTPRTALRLSLIHI